MILPFRCMKNFSSKWLKELENVESGHPNDGCTTVTIPNCRMDMFSPPDVLAPAACHLLRLPSQLPGQLAQGFAIADYLHRVFVCQCCLLELSYQKWKTSSSHRIFHLSQPRVSSRQKSSHNSLLPLQRAFDPPIRFLLPEILVPKIKFRDSQIFFLSRPRFLDINFRKEGCFEILIFGNIWQISLFNFWRSFTLHSFTLAV